MEAAAEKSRSATILDIVGTYRVQSPGFPKIVYWAGVAPRFSTDFCTRTRKRQTSAKSHGAVSLYVHTGRLAEKACSLSLSYSGAIWHINAPKCRREVEIIAPLDTPPQLFVCRSKHAAIETRSRGRGFATGSMLPGDMHLL